jgi:hypothetical protein
VNKFSLRVPRTWIASTTDDGLTVFSDPLTKNDPGQAELKVGVIVRDNDANETIASLGQDEFTNQIIGTLTEDRNGVEVISTKKVMINGTLYYQATVTYLSANNNARVKILVNITYTTDAIIMLAAEAYTDEWDLNKDAIMESMGTFRIN